MNQTAKHYCKQCATCQVTRKDPVKPIGSMYFMLDVFRLSCWTRIQLDKYTAGQLGSWLAALIKIQTFVVSLAGHNHACKTQLKSHPTLNPPCRTNRMGSHQVGVRTHPRCSFSLKFHDKKGLRHYNLPLSSTVQLS